MTAYTKPSATDTNYEIGKNLQILRKAAGLSQSELAGKVGITYQQIQKYEAGTNRISAVRLKEFSDIFQVPLHYFFSNELTAPPSDFFKSSIEDKSIKELLENIPSQDIRLSLYTFINAINAALQKSNTR